MIDANGWFDWAVRVPNIHTINGRPKTNGGVNPAIGIVMHSAEGYRAYLVNYQSDPAYQSRRASWHASILLDGTFMQHFPITAQCWASGSGYPNNNFFTVENEGVAGRDPTTDFQVATAARVHKELMLDRGYPLVRRQTLWEHNEMTRFGSDPTACPSGRIRWDDIIAQATQQPQQPRRLSDMRIYTDPEQRSWLIYHVFTAYIPDRTTYDELHALIYGTGPAALSQATIDWLHAQPDPNTGANLGARFVRVF